MEQPTTNFAASGEASASDSAALRVRDLTKHFHSGGFAPTLRREPIRAVERVSFSLHPGETLGLVGESGCGKTTLGRMLMRLVEPTSGAIEFFGQDILGMRRRDLRKLRREIQIIFQDPFSSLNPRMTIGQIVGEPLYIQGIRGQDLKRRVAELLELVGLQAAHADRYAHAFSGGQRQRIGIARALILEPRVVICDEPVSALDVSVQAQIINLMRDLQKRLNLTYLFIAHDLAVVKHISDRVGVMYLGRIVELGRKDQVFSAPSHPYTRALLSSVPVSHPSERRSRQVLQGNVPSPQNPPPGCHFHTRCPLAQSKGHPRACREESPELREVQPGQLVACHFSEELGRG